MRQMTLIDLKSTDKFRQHLVLCGWQFKLWHAATADTHTLTCCILPQSTPVTAKQDGLACCHSPPLPKHTPHTLFKWRADSDNNPKNVEGYQSNNQRCQIQSTGISALVKSLPASRCQNTRDPSLLICCTNFHKIYFKKKKGLLKLDVSVAVTAAKTNVPEEQQNRSRCQCNLN